jgi:hypothetical protein
MNIIAGAFSFARRNTSRTIRGPWNRKWRRLDDAVNYCYKIIYFFYEEQWVLKLPGSFRKSSSYNHGQETAVVITYNHGKETAYYWKVIAIYPG